MKQTRQWKQSNWTRHQAAPTAARQAIQQQYNFIRPRCAIEIDWIAEMEEQLFNKTQSINKMKNMIIESFL